MDKRKFIIKKLADKTKHKEIAFRMKISQRTLINAINPKHSLSLNTLDRLYDYLKDN